MSLILPTFIAGACLYHLIFFLLARHIAIPEFMIQTLLPVIKKINFLLLFSLPAAFILLFWLGLAISNRLAGPVERLVKEVDEIASGQRLKRLSVRKDDDLKPLIESVNKILDKMGG